MKLTLIITGALGVIEIFTGITVISLANNSQDGIFTFLTMLMGYILIILDLKEQDKLKDAQKIYGQGYEKYLLIASISILIICDLLIYLGIMKNIYLTSPIIMLSWLVPLMTLLAYQSMIVFYQKEIRIENTKVRYKDIQYIYTKQHKKKLCLNIKTKTKEFGYNGKPNKVDLIVKELINKNITVKEDKQ